MKCKICGKPLSEYQTSHCSAECIQEDIYRVRASNNRVTVLSLYPTIELVLELERRGVDFKKIADYK